MFTFLLVVQAVIGALLVTLILMQRSEGGGLGVGGSSSGLMTARGQADFLTRATAFSAVAFVGLSIALAGIATQRTQTTTIDTSLSRTPAAVAPAEEAPTTDSVDNDILGTITSDPVESPGDAPAEEGQ